MTRTEDRLADALRASAGRIGDDRLRPLSEPGREPGPRSARHPGWPRDGRAPGGWRGWLAPLAAAASVALVIGLALALTGGGRPAVGDPAASRVGTVGVTALPRFFAQFTGADPVGSSVELRAIATGKVVASAPAPRQAGWSMVSDGMAAAPGGRTFYVAYTAVHAPSGAAQTRIYRLSVAGTALTPVKGGVIPQSVPTGLRTFMAVSPDGTRLALTVTRSIPGRRYGPGSTDEIAVVDLRTGARIAWQGGLDRSGRTPVIRDVSWTADGRSVVFLMLWCDSAVNLNLCLSALGPPASRTEQVRSVPLTSAAGSLARSTVLLGQDGTLPFIADAVVGPRPGELTLAVLSARTAATGGRPVATVERVAARTGSVLGISYRLVLGPDEETPQGVVLGADPSGQHLLLTYGVPGGFRTGWISQGRLRPLPVRQPYPGPSITAW
jgi:hypothetical protein